MTTREVQVIVVPFLGTEVEIDPLHVIHILLALTAGVTLGNFWNWLWNQYQAPMNS